MGLDRSLAKGNRIYRVAARRPGPGGGSGQPAARPDAGRARPFFASHGRAAPTTRRPDPTGWSTTIAPICRRSSCARGQRSLSRLTRRGTWPPAGPGAQLGPADPARRAGRDPLHLDHRAAGVSVPAAGYRRDQAGPAQGGSQSAVRAGAHRAGGSRPGAGRLRARPLPRVLPARPDRGAVPDPHRRASPMGDRDRDRHGGEQRGSVPGLRGGIAERAGLCAAGGGHPVRCCRW